MSGETKVRGEVRVCPMDGEPVIFTLEFPGAEYACVVCEWRGGVLDPLTAPATPERLARYDALLDRYEAERAARTGLPAPRSVQQGEAPTCGGCGETATGRLDASGKPAHWFSRTVRGVTEYACSRTCITSGVVAPW